MRVLLCCLLAVGLTACAGRPELGEIGKRLGGHPSPSLPTLTEGGETGLPAPQSLRASSGQLREVPLRWEPLLDENVGGYLLQRGNEREGPFRSIAALAGRTSTVYVDDGRVRWPETGQRGPEQVLADGETHFYRVRAFTREGEMGTPSEVVAATTTPAPGPPAGLRAWSHRPRRVPLGWEPSEAVHASGYVLERSPTADGPFETVVRIEDRWKTSWVDEGLGDLRVFYYRIAVLNRAGGRGEATEPVRAVTKPEPLPPIGLRVVSRGLGENQLGWDPNVEQDLTGYRLLRRVEDGVPPEAVAELDADTTEAVDHRVGPGQQVSYTLVARDRDGLESAPSRAVDVVSESYELSATVREDGIHLAWKDRSDEGFTRARVLLEGWLRSDELALVDGWSWVHTDVRAGERYRYRVVLQRPDGTAAASSTLVEIRVPRSWTRWLPGQDSNLRPSG